jgi:heat shock protein HtpX
VTATTTFQQCPQCHSRALARVNSDPPWCTECEWNLAQWQKPQAEHWQKRSGVRRWARVLRDRRRAFAMNQRLLRELRGGLPDKPSLTRAGVILAAASALLLIFDIALLVGGTFLLVTGTWPLRLLAVIMILTGYECRLRFPKIERHSEVSRDEAPNLWAAVDQARAALGAPAIDRLVISSEYNAWCGHTGFRRRTVLGLGLPLWGALSPAGRQALLGHELGHLVNGDPATSFATQPALTTFATLAEVFDPDDLVDADNVIHELLATIVAYLVYWPVHRVCRGAQKVLRRIAAEDHQRAEIYADALGVRLGGSDGAEEVDRALLFEDAVMIALRRAAADSADPQVWRAEAAAALAERTTDLVVAEQRSMRYETRWFADHPPSGLRVRLIRSWPRTRPTVPIDTRAMAAIDRELARSYKTAQRAILNGALD